MADLIALQILALTAALVWALWLRPRPLAVVPLTVVLLHIVCLQFWVLTTGLILGLDLVPWRIAQGALWPVVLLAAILTRRSLREEWSAWRSRAARTMSLLGPWRCGVLLGGVTLVCGFLTIVAAVVGPYLGDVTSYHLAPPTDWITNGRIDTLAWPDPRSFWPQGHGLLTIVYGLPLHSFHALTVTGLHWLLLAFASAWALCRQMGGSVRTAMLACLSITAIPIVWAQATSGLNDLAA